MSEKVLNPNQTKAIAALISNSTVEAAADEIGITSKTIYRYMQDPAFVEALNAAQDELIQEAKNRLVAGLNVALDTLKTIMETGDQSNKRLASVAWIDRTLKVTELTELESRISQLEEREK